jgi:hypothetical protein
MKLMDPEFANDMLSFGDLWTTRDHMPPRQDVIVFVDWNSQIGNGGQLAEVRPLQRAQAVAEYVAKSVAACVSPRTERILYRVAVRLYYGWYKGLTATDARVSLQRHLEDGILPVAVNNVTFDWSNMFGDNMLDAYSHRLHRKLRIHLPDTLRIDLDTGQREREKMVDTAMACDILFSARSDPSCLRIVMSEDDDIVPPIFMAERWAKDKGGKTILLRDRDTNGFLMLDGICRKLERA